MPRVGTANYNLGTWPLGDHPLVGSQTEDSDLLNGNWIKIDTALHSISSSVASLLSDFQDHENDIGNPHSVSNSQVGLGNVTNDAQLKRSANDYSAISEKTTLHSNDIILIEDSEASYAKKKVKRSNIVKTRVTSIASDDEPSPNCDTTDLFVITALAEAAEIQNPTGTPYDGQKLEFRIYSAGAYALTWGTDYASRGATLPDTTVAGKYTRAGVEWNAQASKWDCIATDQEE